MHNPQNIWTQEKVGTVISLEILMLNWTNIWNECFFLFQVTDSPLVQPTSQLKSGISFLRRQSVPLREIEENACTPSRTIQNKNAGEACLKNLITNVAILSIKCALFRANVRKVRVIP